MGDLQERLDKLTPERRKLLQLLEKKKAAAAGRTKAEPSSTAPSPPRIEEDRWFNLEPGAFPEKQDIRDFYNTVTAQLDAGELGRHSFFLNWGYVPNHLPQFAQKRLPDLYLNKNTTRLVLEMIADTPLKAGDQVLDVGCGRGGTVSVFRDFFNVGRVVGIDLSSFAVAFCRARHRYNETFFVHGDSEQLPFADASMSVVTNLESSHCYPNVERFYQGVFRLLTPGGYFCYADILPALRVEELERMLKDVGFQMLRRRDVTSNVLLSCEDVAGTHARAFAGNNEHVTKNFLAVPGSRIYNDMQNSAQVYMLYQFRKPELSP